MMVMKRVYKWNDNTADQDEKSGDDHEMMKIMKTMLIQFSYLKNFSLFGII